MIAEVLAAYGNEVAPHKASARDIGYNITNLLKWWGDKTVANISAQDLPGLYRNQDGKPAAGADLKILKAAVKHWHKEYGPLDAVPLFEMPPPNPRRNDG
jgi:hypothetical protein